MEIDNLSVQIVNGVIVGNYNGQTIVGLLNIAQTLSELVGYTISGLYGIVSALYYSLKQLATRIIPSQEEINEINNFLSLLQKYVT